MNRVTVYPCAYREHDLLLFLFIFNRGLSLCIQGTWEPDGYHGVTSRFIPVHTGNIAINARLF